MVAFLRALRATGYEAAVVAQPSLFVSRGRGALVAFCCAVGASRVMAIDPETGGMISRLGRGLGLAEGIRFISITLMAKLVAAPAAGVVRLGGAACNARLPQEPDSISSAGAVLYLRTDSDLSLTPLLMGGSQAHTDGILGALERRGHPVIFWSTGMVAGRAEHLEGGRLRGLVRGNVPREVSEFVAGLVQYAQLAATPPPAFIYQRYSLNNLAGLWLARRWRVPLVLEANAAEARWRREWSSLQFPSLAAATETLLLRRATRIATVSDNAATDLIQAGATPNRLRVIPNGVDVDRFSGAEPARLPFSPSGFIVCFAGMFYPWHGAAVLARAFCLLRDARAEARLVLVGDGEERSLTAAILREAGVDTDVLFTGLVAPGNVPRYLAAADVLVSPHVPNDRFIGSPIKLWEYMASGKAIVASKVAQLGQVVRDHETGLLVPPGDSVALANRLVELHDDPALRHRLGSAAQTEARASHSWDARLEQSLAP